MLVYFNTEYSQVERALKELQWSLGKGGAEVAQRIRELKIERDEILRRSLWKEK
jgi:hypothetical protein